MNIEVEERDDVVVVKPVGRVVRENQTELRAELERLVRGGALKIALNLEMVDYMDSAGLGCCSFISKLLGEQASGAVAVFGASRNLEKTWTLIRLDLVIPLFANEAESLAWLRRRL